MKWITREHVKVDRVACPWLIKKFIDKDAKFLFVPTDQVMELAEQRAPSHVLYRPCAIGLLSTATIVPPTWVANACACVSTSSAAFCPYACAKRYCGTTISTCGLAP